MRNINVDIARGALILYIITFVHGSYWLGFLSGPYKSWILFEMPMIFMVSGYSFALFERKGFYLTVGNYTRYLYARSVRILLPYVVYAFVCALVVVFMQQKYDVKAIILVFADWLNPITRGTFHPYGMLSWHLWFIFPFLIVAGLLPILAHLRPPFRLTLLAATIVSCFARDTLIHKAIITPLFYLFWAYAGYILANGRNLKRSHHVLVVVISIGLVFMLHRLLSVSLNMQNHKFPPTVVFMLFNTVWASLFIFIFSYMNLSRIRFIADLPIFRLFIIRGYSIFLWQGMGYTVASMIGSQFQLGVYTVWLLAIGMTVGFGYFFGKLEEIRFRV